MGSGDFVQVLCQLLYGSSVACLQRIHRHTQHFSEIAFGEGVLFARPLRLCPDEENARFLAVLEF